ncbi:hypothetical protein Tco_0694506 [Tanacetum coccineum]
MQIKRRLSPVVFKVLQTPGAFGARYVIRLCGVDLVCVETALLGLEVIALRLLGEAGSLLGRLSRCIFVYVGT